MKSKEITVKKEDLNIAIDVLAEKNQSYLVIAGNMFSLDKISTLIKPRFESSDMMMNRSMIVEFAYADKVMPMAVKLILNFENESCIKFIEESKMLNESQIKDINDKITACFKENYTYDEDKLKSIIDEVALNEAVLVLIQGVNKDDCEDVKNDFISKYETWKSRNSEENIELGKLMNRLYANLLSVKVWNKTIA